MLYASDTAWRYATDGEGSASALTCVEAQIAAVPASRSSSRGAAFTSAASSGRRRQRGHALGELEQVQSLPPNTEVEVDQDDRDLEDRDSEAAHRDDARLIFRAFNELEVGGLIVGDVPTFRIDHMPYGGVKDSGLGREGLRYAIEEMTEPRLLAMNLR